MSQPFVFLTDVDGTLLRRDAPLSDAVCDAARAFTGAGGLLALSTGRSVVAAEAVAAALGVNLPCILYGGASLYDFSAGRHLFRQPFEEDIRPALAAVVAEHPSVSVQAFSDEAIFVLQRNRRLREKGVQEEDVGPEVPASAVHGELLKVVMCCDDPAELEAIRPLFPAPACNFAFSSRNFVDVVPGQCSKALAMAALSERTGVPLSRFLCAGDAITDLEMLRAAGRSYAPANALEPVRQAVDLVVPSVTENGMAAAFLDAASRIRQGAVQMPRA